MKLAGRLGRSGVVVAIALFAVAVPIPASWVERFYSTGWYPALQRQLTGMSNAVPFTLLDLLGVVAIALWLRYAVRDFTGQTLTRARALVRVTMRTGVIAAVAYLAFLALWGLNYRRAPMAERLAFDQARVSDTTVMALANTAVDRVNGLHAPAHAAPPERARTVDPVLAAAFDRTQRDLGYGRHAVPGRPKTTILDLYFRRAGVAGMIDPYFLETLIASDLLPFERPFVIAHEWSHLAGVADEGEANFAGWLTCLRADAPQQYSGWLFLYGELAAALPRHDARAVSSRLGSGPRADLQAIRERLQRNVNPRVSDAGWRVYDKYLKANRVEEGAKSYAEVVRLATGVSFTGDYVPILREGR